MVINNLRQNHTAAMIIEEYVESSYAWRMKLAKMHPEIHFGELAQQMITDEEAADAVMTEYLAILASINEELEKPDRADMHKNISVPVATEMDGILGSREAKSTDQQTFMNRAKASSPLGTSTFTG